jgi:hypothetical protein
MIFTPMVAKDEICFHQPHLPGAKLELLFEAVWLEAQQV